MAKKKPSKQARGSEGKTPELLPESPATPRIKVFPYLLLFTISFLLYANTLGHQYALDDLMLIRENTFTQKGISGMGDIFTNDAFTGFFGEDRQLLEGGRYRPLSHATFALEYELFGLNPFWGHLFNVLLYAFLVCLVFHVLLRLLPGYVMQGKWWISLPFLAALLFAIHPVHTEAVANIKGRDEIMSLLFSLLTLHYFISWIRQKKPLTGILTGLFFLLALLSKENALTFLAVIPIAVYFFTDINLKKNFKYFSLLIVPVVLFFILRYQALGFFFGEGRVSAELLNNPFLHAEPAEKYATIFYTLGRYVQLLFFPHPLTHDYYPYHISLMEWGNWQVILSFLLYGFFGIFALFSLKNKNIAGFGVLFFLLTLSVVSNLAVPVGTFMNERFVFMPSLGFAISVGYLLWYGIQKLQRPIYVKYLSVGLLLLMILGFSLKTVTRNPVWKDDFTLFTHDVRISENSAKVNVSAGGALIERSGEVFSEVREQEKLQQAVVYLQRGLDIHPRYTSGWILLGNAYTYSGDFQNAYHAYLSAMEISPGHNLVLNNLKALGQKSRNEQQAELSVDIFSKLIEIQPDNPGYLYEKARALEQLEKIDEALYFFKQSVEKESLYYLSYNKLGELYGKFRGDLEQSIHYLEKAHGIKPDHWPALENLGVAHALKGEVETSLDYFLQAYELKPDNAQLLHNISMAYRQLGKMEEAITFQQKSQALQ